MPCQLSLVVFPALFSIAATGAAKGLEDMAGSTIVVAERLEAVEYPDADLYDCTGQPANLYRFEGQDVCLSIGAGYDYSCDGILSEKGGTQSILVSGPYRDHIRKVEGTQVSCPRQRRYPVRPHTRSAGDITRRNGRSTARRRRRANRDVLECPFARRTQGIKHPCKTPEADLAGERLIAGDLLSSGQPLWKTFWLFFATGFLLLSVAVRQAIMAIVDPLMQEAPGKHAVVLTLWRMIGVELVRLTYLCLSLVMVWCYGHNSRWVTTRRISRAVLSALILLTLYSIYLV